MMTAQADACTPNAVLDRVSLVLDAFDGPGRLSLAQVVRRTGLPRSSAHRMLERLVQLRWLRRQGRDYELGMRLVELGSLAVHQDGLHRAAQPFLHDLHRATGLVVHLAVLDGTDVVYLEKIAGGFGAAIPTRVGGRQPAHCTAVGKALLAFSDPSRLDDFDIDLLARKTRYSISTRRQLTEELKAIRARGVAYERGESVAGFGCVAAPIGDISQPNEPMAAVSVCGPLDRMAFDHRLAGPVRMTALSIWRNFDDGGGVRVQPVLQQPRPLHGRQAPGKPVAATPVRTLQYA
jgi:DNA-binding IclR family transcriptional regulator